MTAHVGEFSTANIAAVLALPGLTWIGHTVHAARDPRLLDRVARSGVTVECCLSCNVVLGTVSSYEEHPIRRFTAHGIPVVLGTDDPVQVCTTIGREYAIAAALDFFPCASSLVGLIPARHNSGARIRQIRNELARMPPSTPMNGVPEKISHPPCSILIRLIVCKPAPMPSAAQVGHNSAARSNPAGLSVGYCAPYWTAPMSANIP